MEGILFTNISSRTDIDLDSWLVIRLEERQLLIKKHGEENGKYHDRNAYFSNLKRKRNL